MGRAWISVKCIVSAISARSADAPKNLPKSMEVFNPLGLRAASPRAKKSTVVFQTFSVVIRESFCTHQEPEIGTKRVALASVW